jgi:hypothetical protein
MPINTATSGANNHCGKNVRLRDITLAVTGGIFGIPMENRCKIGRADFVRILKPWKINRDILG